MLTYNFLVIDTAQSGDFLDFALEQGHRVAPLEFLHSVEYFITQRLADAVDELLHFLLGIQKVIDVEV